MDLLSNLSLGFPDGAGPCRTCSMPRLSRRPLGTLIGVLPGLPGRWRSPCSLPEHLHTGHHRRLIDASRASITAPSTAVPTTAILINVPGEASSVVTAIDGHQMARRGEAGTALAVAGLGSFFAGCAGTLIIAAFAFGTDRLGLRLRPSGIFL